jgi:hypothetical protein
MHAKNASIYQDRLGTNIGKVEKRVAFSYSMYTGSLITPTEQKIQLVGMFGAKTPLLSHLMLKMHHFTKTGSGQT